jgi:hypothetical protein
MESLGSSEQETCAAYSRNGHTFNQNYKEKGLTWIQWDAVSGVDDMLDMDEFGSRDPGQKDITRKRRNDVNDSWQRLLPVAFGWSVSRLPLSSDRPETETHGLSLRRIQTGFFYPKSVGEGCDYLRSNATNGLDFFLVGRSVKVCDDAYPILAVNAARNGV